MYYIIYDHDWQPLRETAPSHSQGEMAGGGALSLAGSERGVAIVEATEGRRWRHGPGTRDRNRSERDLGFLSWTLEEATTLYIV